MRTPVQSPFPVPRLHFRHLVLLFRLSLARIELFIERLLLKVAVAYVSSVPNLPQRVLLLLDVSRELLGKDRSMPRE